ncbi:MAG: SMP-30/gluconolactonase/LRE family protein [Actinomycetota bacterium]|nr:SMP-30/gluconolactonase/LRE family protein [Actinomycetota bacterium]
MTTELTTEVAIELEEVAAGLRFPEGPVAMADGSVIVVEIAAGRVSRVAPDGTTLVVAETGGGPNGAAIGPDGALYVCNNGGFEWHDGPGGGLIPGDQPADYTGGSIQRIDLGTGAVETVYTHCGDVPLNGPNDLVFDATGGFWFTDLGKSRGRDKDRGCVYYAQPDGSSITEMIQPLESPNGIGLSPDGTTLHVADTVPGRVWSWTVTGPGRLADPSPRSGHCLVGLPGHQMLDSLAIDAAGNVCVATIVNGGITIVAPDGTTRHVPTGDPVTTNICFGGPDHRTAWITLSYTGRLVKATWPEPGLPLAFGA